MKYLRMFLLHSQYVFAERGRSFIWFLYSVIPPAIFLLFWIGALKSQGGNIAGWNLSTITTYYFLLTIASSMLVAHIEEDIAWEDIQEGHLTGYLLKPFSYYWIKFLEEVPWRLLQGSYGIVLIFAFIVIFGNFFTLSNNPLVIALSLLICLLAFMLSFTFKTVLGLLAFWLTDTNGLFQLSDAVVQIFGGFIVPITLLPSLLQHTATFLPFAYMAYYPVVAIQGQLGISELAKVILFQVIWIVSFALLYKWLWIEGRKKYTAIGQ